MTDISLIERLIQETAQRHAIALLPDLASLSRFGAHPRLGTVLDSLNAANRPVAAVFSIGVYRFRPADYALDKGGQLIRLTEKERDILLALVQAGAPGIDRKTMLEKIWLYASGVETHTLETHIYRLRQKIEDDPGRPKLLLTEGDDYRLADSTADF